MSIQKAKNACRNSADVLKLSQVFLFDCISKRGVVHNVS
jgi:hypothetical protein